MRRESSLQARVLGGAAVATGLTVAVLLHLMSPIGGPELILVTGACVAAVTLVVHLFLRVPLRRLRALRASVEALREGDYSLSLAPGRSDEVGRLSEVLDALTDTLRTQRINLHQREWVLDTVVQSTPQALVLVDAGGRIVFANRSAVALFRATRDLAETPFADVLVRLPAALSDALEQRRDGLITVSQNAETELYQVASSAFTLNGLPHLLFQVLRLTRELHQQELLTWKKVIRVISHELNNSLAPISSLAYSAQKLLQRGETGRLQQPLVAIAERSRHLSKFLREYADFARLPPPHPEPLDWVELVKSLQQVMAFEVSGELPATTGWADRGQLEQVLVNLLKNAHESGSDPGGIELAIRCEDGGTAIRVSDAGSGMSETVLTQALLPFYTTKTQGSGLGLALTREVVEAHDGRLAISNRSPRGLEVLIWLPAGQD